MRVLLYERAYQRIAARLRAEVPGVEPLRLQDDGSLVLEAGVAADDDARFDAAWANTDVFLSPRVRDFMVLCLKSAELRFVQSSAAGFEHPVFSMLVDKGIVLANSNASAISIAEFVLSRVLDELQPNAERRALQAERRWARTPFREVYGQRWLIVGLGNIGREVATRARAFGALVTGVRRTPRGDEGCDRVLPLAQLDQALAEADVIVLAAPSNPQSQHLMNAARLRTLRPGCILVNVARGALIDEAALLEGLERGQPATAILDVFETEPLPDACPLWLHPRVRVSAHNAANGDGFVARNDALFLRNLRRFAAGEQLEQVVDPQLVRASLGPP